MKKFREFILENNKSLNESDNGDIFDFLLSVPSDNNKEIKRIIDSKSSTELLNIKKMFEQIKSPSTRLKNVFSLIVEKLGDSEYKSLLDEVTKMYNEKVRDKGLSLFIKDNGKSYFVMSLSKETMTSYTYSKTDGEISYKSVTMLYQSSGTGRNEELAINRLNTIKNAIIKKQFFKEEQK